MPTCPNCTCTVANEGDLCTGCLVRLDPQTIAVHKQLVEIGASLQRLEVLTRYVKETVERMERSPYPLAQHKLWTQEED